MINNITLSERDQALLYKALLDPKRYDLDDISEIKEALEKYRKYVKKLQKDPY